MLTSIDFCQFPLCTRLARHRHHLTYRPEVTTRLCVRHHKHITIINCNRAFAVGRKLTNRERLDIWHEWIEGRLKPIYTRSARAWVRKWRRRRT